LETYSGVNETAPIIAPDYWDKITRRWLSNTDNDYSGYANLNYKMKRFGQDIVWTVGAMNRTKQRSQFYDSYKFSFTTDELVTGTTTNDPGTFNPIPGITSAVFSGINNTSSVEDPNNYTLQEDVNAFYVQGKINIGPQIQVIGGLRNENTIDSYQSNQSLYESYSYGTITYHDYLPSIEVTYALNPKMNLKASYYSSIARPNFFEIVPYSITQDYYTYDGNPLLKRTQADNIDLRYEFFPAPGEEILIGGFYKVLTDPIEYEFTNPSATTITPVNDTANKATNYGFELQAVKYFNHWGISGNYTFTESQITVSDAAIYFYNNHPVNDGVINETRPLQGQAKSIANLSLIYKDPKTGLDAQLSGVYTGKLISQASEYYGLDYWQMPMLKMDFSIEKRISKKYKISVYGKAMNILNTPYLIELFPSAFYNNNPVTNPDAWLPGQSTNNGYLNHIVVEKETYGQSWLVGIRYKF
jgi:TonB-dependent receptor